MMLFTFVDVEGVYWIPSHYISGLEEDNMVY